MYDSKLSFLLLLCFVEAVFGVVVMRGVTRARGMTRAHVGEGCYGRLWPPVVARLAPPVAPPRLAAPGAAPAAWPWGGVGG